MDADTVWGLVDDERAALAGILQDLTPEEWEHPSACSGWTVRDVAAHVVSSAQPRPAETLRAVIRARGDFNRCMFDEAKRRAARPTGEIIADYRRARGSRRHPPGTTRLDPLCDVLVHTQDIVRPLGRRHPMPAVASAAAADQVWRRSFPFRARRRLTGLRLVADDVDWTRGDGPLVRGSMGALLLLLTGRSTAVAELAGDGAARLVGAG